MLETAHWGYLLVKHLKQWKYVKNKQNTLVWNDFPDYFKIELQNLILRFPYMDA